MAGAKKTRCGNTMTESAWLAWVRSALRSKSLRWKPRGEALRLARRPYKGSNKLQKHEYQCSMCSGWFKGKEVVVDHHPKPAGSILSIDDIGEFCNNLFCEVDNLRCLCVDCHKIHTLSEKKGISHEDAAHEKKVNDFMRLDKHEVLAFLAEKGYTGSTVSNESKRKALVSELLKEKVCLFV